MSAVKTSVLTLLARQDQEAEGFGWSQSAGRAVTQRLGDEGWLSVGLAEDLDGGGGDLRDAVDVVDAVTSLGWPSPAADVLLISNPLLEAARLADPGGLVLTVPAVATGTPEAVTVTARRVPWAPWATSYLLVVDDGSGALTLCNVDAEHAALSAGSRLNGTPVGDVRFEGAPAGAYAALGSAECLTAAGTLARAVQTGATLARVEEITTAFIAMRRQFGRPIAAFQAVQQHLAALAGETASSSAALSAALAGRTSIAAGQLTPSLAAARIRGAFAGDEVTRLAHQLHGAIGTTREYELHRHTLSLMSWRNDFAAPAHLARRLASLAIESDALWPWLLDD
jgi:acyl-CoA dehydrogenase